MFYMFYRASDMVMRVSALLMSEPQTESRKEVDYHGDQFRSVFLNINYEGRDTHYYEQQRRTNCKSCRQVAQIS